SSRRRARARPSSRASRPLTVPFLCRRGAGGPDVRTVLMRMVAAGLRARSSGTRPDVKQLVSLTVACANGTCRQSGARRQRAPTVRTAARLWLCPGVLPGVYEPRSAAGTVLHQVVRTHLAARAPQTNPRSDDLPPLTVEQRRRRKPLQSRPRPRSDARAGTCGLSEGSCLF